MFVFVFAVVFVCSDLKKLMIANVLYPRFSLSLPFLLSSLQCRQHKTSLDNWAEKALELYRRSSRLDNKDALCRLGELCLPKEDRVRLGVRFSRCPEHMHRGDLPEALERATNHLWKAATKSVSADDGLVRQPSLRAQYVLARLHPYDEKAGLSDESKCKFLGLPAVVSGSEEFNIHTLLFQSAAKAHTAVFTPRMKQNEVVLTLAYVPVFREVSEGGGAQTLQCLQCSKKLFIH